MTNIFKQNLNVAREDISFFFFIHFFFIQFIVSIIFKTTAKRILFILNSLNNTNCTFNASTFHPYHKSRTALL